MQMAKDNSIEEYLQIATDLKNNLSTFEHKMVDEMLVQLTLNGLLPSYDGIIQSLKILDKLISFVTINLKL